MKEDQVRCSFGVWQQKSYTMHLPFAEENYPIEVGLFIFMQQFENYKQNNRRNTFVWITMPMTELLHFSVHNNVLPHSRTVFSKHKTVVNIRYSMNTIHRLTCEINPCMNESLNHVQFHPNFVDDVIQSFALRNATMNECTLYIPHLYKHSTPIRGHHTDKKQ